MGLMQEVTDDEARRILEEELEEVSSDEDFSDDETILERVSAMKELVPSSIRNFIGHAVYGTKSFLQSSFKTLGTATWLITSSFLFLLLPIIVQSEEERQIMEEHKQRLQQQRSLLQPELYDLPKTEQQQPF